mgnify:CR=1 FL=1
MASTISQTHDKPGRQKLFEWNYDADQEMLCITTEMMTERKYTLDEIRFVLQTLQEQFGAEWFPLANNPALLHDGKERPGLGMVLWKLRRDVKHAQGAVYLGVVLEELGFLEWNRRDAPVGWRVIAAGMDKTMLRLSLTNL